MAVFSRILLLALTTLLLTTPAGAQPAEAPRFDIMEFQVVGNTVLPDSQIEQAVMPFMGPQLSLDQVEAARMALEKLYQGAGYLTVFVDIPDQRVDDGVVRLQVTEGKVDRLSVTGSRYYAQGRIRAGAAEVAEGQVPNFNVVQQQVAALSRSETRRVQPVLKPGALPGTVDVELKVSDQLPAGASIEMNNSHAAGVVAPHVVANLHYDNLFQREHSASLTLMGTPTAPEQSKVAVAGYAVPFDDGDSLSASLIWSNSNVATLGGTQALGKGTTLGLRYLKSLTAPWNGWHALTVGADYKDLQEQTVFGGGSISTPLRYVPVQAAYSGGYGSERWLSQWNLTLNYGFAPLLRREVPNCPSANGGIAPVDQFACKRAGSDGSFTTAKLDLRQTLQTADWGQVSLHAVGQLANEPLQNSEQFVLGGVDTVRGYYDSSALGDGGLFGSLEWRRDFAPMLRRAAGEAASANLREMTLLAFFDGGRVYTQHALPGTPGHETLGSVGLGLRFQSATGLSLSLDLARAFKDLPGQAVPGSYLHVRLGQKL
ncbi:POTRA domain-containing protein [Paucibacter sp. R3-3]|uniref:POTRA domain-containing protein n=1 Tax=Roseateles agri TaxID=3098619 RepID=A0ABU5DAN1_9BURK|nr:POTRA domain-containing protein [Paucibacter sp. R3-3]MDY0743327.1 POTRA domain-containing protein [Paucibacter sp. R3-3]